MILVRNRQQPLSGNNLLLFLSFMVILGACSAKVIAPVKPPVTPPIVQKPKEKIPEVIKPVEKPAEVKIVAKKPFIISLLLPFGLDNIAISTATLKQISSANLALDYYQGFKMGLDSVAFLNNSNFILQVYDCGNNVQKNNALMLKKEIKNSDLIVGPVFPSTVKSFTTFIKSLKIPVVSPLAPTNPYIYSNPYLITVNNTLNQHAYVAAAFIKNTLKPKKVLQIRSGQAEEYKYATPFKKGMDSLAKGLPFKEVGIKAIGYKNISQYLNPKGLNVIVLPSTEETFLEAVLKELDKLSLTFDIAVIGHPNWEKSKYLNIETLQRLNTYLTSSYHINYKSSIVAAFIKNYHQKFSVEPSEYAYKGFDTGFFMASLMANEGKDYFLAIEKKSFTGLHNQFQFIKDKKNGYFNADVMMLKYQNFELLKIN